MLALLCTFILSVSAQTQDFPDLSVQGESGIKTHLNKHPVPLAPLVSVSDSLPPYVPSGLMTLAPEVASASKVLNGYLQLELNTSVGVNSYLSFYPNNSSIYAVSHRMNLKAPKTDLLSLQNYISMGADLSKDIPLVFRLEHNSSKAPDYKASMLDFSVSHHRQKLDYKSLRFKDLYLKLGLNGVRQDILTNEKYDSYISLAISERLVYEKMDMYSKILSYSGDVGIQIAPKLMVELPQLNNLRFHILADKFRVLPSISFLYRNQLSDLLVFSAANDPYIVENGVAEIMDEKPWVQLEGKHKLDKAPVNISTSFELRYPQSDLMSMSSLKLNSNLRYDIHSPQLSQGAVYGVPLLYFTDVSLFTNSLEAFFEMRDFSFKQAIQTQLGYLPQDNWYRAGYIPVLNLSSYIDYRYLDWTFSVDLQQNYFTKDHNGKNLPESVIVDICAEYRNGDTSFYTQLANLLNHQQWVFTEYPATKRNLFVGIKHRF